MKCSATAAVWFAVRRCADRFFSKARCFAQRALAAFEAISMRLSSDSHSFRVLPLIS
jgi:hypothetical protein